VIRSYHVFKQESQMAKSAHFTVDTRLAALLGENYRSTEAALKELVDNAWDADAPNVWITLPAAMTTDPIVVRDDGSGMSQSAMQEDYLHVARDRRSRRGDKTPVYGRKVKGRKGIGKFAGLAAANLMNVTSVAEGIATSVSIDKATLLSADEDLERIDLPLETRPASPTEKGTTIVLSALSRDLQFPTEEEMRLVLVYEYGRVQGFSIFVNGAPLSIEDVPGTTYHKATKLHSAGDASVRVTISEGPKAPKYPGIILLTGGKSVGKPSYFGLEDDEEIPRKLLRRVFGQIEVDGLEKFVTSGWDSVFENSEAYQEMKSWVQPILKEALTSSYRREVAAQQARLNANLKRRIERLPEHRREFAHAAIQRLLDKFYGEKPERIDAIANVVLDAMERDEYWSVLRRINEARRGEVADFAEALEQFGLLELSLIADNAAQRLRFIEGLELLAADSRTTEKEMHKAIENSLWVLGGQYQMISSNTTLRRTVEEYVGTKYAGEAPNKRPDLMLAMDASASYTLVEFKRPSHKITRQDEAQAQVYRDELARYLPAKLIEILVIGGGRVGVDARYGGQDLAVLSYADMLARARHDYAWLLTNLRGH